MWYLLVVGGDRYPVELVEVYESWLDTTVIKKKLKRFMMLPLLLWLQHGPAECFLDMVEACALDVWPHLVSC